MWTWLCSLNALLFSKMSVLSPASTWSCLLLCLTFPAGSSCQPSDLGRLPFVLLFLCICMVTAGALTAHPNPLCNVKTFPLTSIQCLARMSPPFAPFLNLVFSMPLSSFPIPHLFKEIPPYLRGTRK